MSAPRKKSRVVVCSCPTCGQPVSDGGLRVDLAGNVLLADGRAIKLQSRQAELLWYLLQQYPRLTSDNSILVNVWANADVCIATLKGAIKTTKTVLNMVGWTIKNERGLGYRIAPLEQHAKAPSLPSDPPRTSQSLEAVF